MDHKLDEKLVKAFPNLYSDRHRDMKETCMCWGFECGDGWFDLIWELSEKLERCIIEYKKDSPDDYPKASQVKEKYGELRFYTTFSTDEMDDIIDDYELKSSTICEVCGDSGVLRNDGGWYRTLCDKCAG